MSKVGKLIALTRQVRGTSIAELARATKRSENHLRQIEDGFLVGTPATLLELAAALDIARETMRDAYVQDAAYTSRLLWERGESVKRKRQEKATQ